MKITKLMNTFTLKVTIVSTIALVIFIVAIQGNHILGQAFENSYVPSTGTEPKPETSPPTSPCPADTWPYIFDGNHVVPGAVENSFDLPYALAVTRDGSYLYLGGD